jgi:hypothetical protein
MEEEILNRLQALPERRNPFDEGIAKAVSSTRSNLGMSRDQEHRAINNALLALGNGLASEPQVRGFKNNLGVIGRAMNPALAAYNTSEDAAISENERLASQILKHQRAQEELEAAKEEKAWHRKFQERQLEETKRHHNLLDNFRTEELKYKKNKHGSDSELDRLAPKIRTDSAFDKVGLQARKSAEFYEEVKEMNHKYQDLKDTMTKAGIDTTNPFVFNKALRNASGFLSSFTKDPTQREIASKYADLAAANKRAMQSAEKALKDGALTNFTVKYGDDNKLYPSFGSEPYDEYERKLKTMLNDARTGYESSSLALQTGRHIDKHNYAKIKELEHSMQMGVPTDPIGDMPTSQGSVDPSMEEEWITIKGPSGEIKEIHFEDAPNFLNRPGYTRVK